MRSEVFPFVALSMMLACSNMTEPTQGNSAIGGTSGVVGSAATEPNESAANGGSPDKSAGGGSDEAGNDATENGGTRNPTNGRASSAERSSVGGTANTSAKNVGGTKSSGSAKGNGGSKNTASNQAAGGDPSTENSGGSKSTRATRAGGGSNTGGSSSGNNAPVGCDRAGLQAAVDAYLAALDSKDTSKMPLSSSVKYTEVTSVKGSNIPLGEGLWQTAQPVAFSRSLLDVTGCETFTEVFITESSHPYVLGTRLAVKDGEITEIYTIATDSDDWNFDATAYSKCSESEDWSELPEATRSSREVLIAAGQAYFDIFSDKSTEVPWGTPCYRLEGGKGCTPAMDKASKTCNIGIPEGITFSKTHWVVDVDIGAVVGITLFGGANPDTHLFRLVDGKIRYVHTLTVMK